MTDEEKKEYQREYQKRYRESGKKAIADRKYYLRNMQRIRDEKLAYYYSRTGRPYITRGFKPNKCDIFSVHL